MTEDSKVNVGTVGHIDHGKPSLSPCPFCGGEVEYYYEGSHDWVFDCEPCRLSANFYIPHIGDETAAAIKAWNTRA